LLSTYIITKNIMVNGNVNVNGTSGKKSSAPMIVGLVFFFIVVIGLFVYLMRGNKEEDLQEDETENQAAENKEEDLQEDETENQAAANAVNKAAANAANKATANAVNKATANAVNKAAANGARQAAANAANKAAANAAANQAAANAAAANQAAKAANATAAAANQAVKAANVNLSAANQAVNNGNNNGTSTSNANAAQDNANAANATAANANQAVNAANQAVNAANVNLSAANQAVNNGNGNANAAQDNANAQANATANANQAVNAANQAVNAANQATQTVQALANNTANANPQAQAQAIANADTAQAIAAQAQAAAQALANAAQAQSNANAQANVNQAAAQALANANAQANVNQAAAQLSPSQRCLNYRAGDNNDLSGCYDDTDCQVRKTDNKPCRGSRPNGDGIWNYVKNKNDWTCTTKNPGAGGNPFGDLCPDEQFRKGAAPPPSAALGSAAAGFEASLVPYDMYQGKMQAASCGSKWGNNSDGSPISPLNPNELETRVYCNEREDCIGYMTMPVNHPDAAGQFRPIMVEDINQVPDSCWDTTRSTPASEMNSRVLQLKSQPATTGPSYGGFN